MHGRLRALATVMALLVYSAPATSMAASAKETALETLARAQAAVAELGATTDPSRDDVKAVARAAGKDPAALHAFVRDEIRFEPYHGALRGAHGTLVGRAGNALDQSLLLSAMLRVAGFESRIAVGELSKERAAALVGTAKRKAPPAGEAAIPASLGERVARALGSDPQRLDEVKNTLLAAAERVDEALWDRVETEHGALADALKDVPPPAIADTDTSREHYWVRYRDAAGAWHDLDPSVAASKPGERFAEPLDEHAPKAIPDALYHTLRVTMTVRTAPRPGAEGAPEDVVMVDAALKVARLGGHGITLASYPNGALSPGSGAAPPRAKALSGVREFTALLMVADEEIADGKTVDLSGRVFTSPPGTDTGIAERARTRSGKALAGAGSALGGLADRISGKQPAPATPKGRRIVAQWVDYTLTSPRGSGQEPLRRKYRRAFLDEDPAATPDDDRVRAAMIWSVELLPLTHAVPPAYVGHRQIASLGTNGKFHREMLASAYDGRIDQTNAILSQPERVPLHSLALATAVDWYADLLAEARFPGLHAYRHRAGLLAFERRVLRASGDFLAYQVGYDIIDESLAILPGDHDGTAIAEYRMLRGVLATDLERWLVARRGAQLSRDGDISEVINAITLFDRARAQGIGAVVIRPDDPQRDDRLGRLEIPTRAREAMAADLARGQLVVTPSRPVAVAGAPRTGWWRVDPLTGATIGVMEDGRGQSAIQYKVLAVAMLTSLEFHAAFLTCLTGVKMSGNPGIGTGGCALMAGAAAAGAWGTPLSHALFWVGLIGTWITLAAN